jgi:hypothetical protein
VRIGTVFSTRIEVFDLDPVELGALLWLFTLEDGCHLRVGGAKPLGFGSVTLQLRALEVIDGAEKARQLGSLMPVGGPVETDARRFTNGYKEAIEAAYGAPFERVSFIEAFLAAACGDTSLPVHYPRMDTAPNPAGRNYEWFVRNENAGARHALPDLVSRKGLPRFRKR